MRRRAMLILQAVVPNVMDCRHGSSTGITLWISLHQCSASTSTKGAVRECRMVFGEERLRSRPERNGHFHRVAPSASGSACRVSRHRLVEPSLVGELFFLWTSPGRQGQIPKLLRQQAREELTVDQQRLPGERLHSTLVGDGQKV